MGERVNIFFLLPPSRQLGGCTSFTVHLLKMFEYMGYDPVLYRIGREGIFAFPYGVTGHTVSLETAVQVAQGAPSMIAYCFWSKCQDQAKALIELGVPMVVHDPAEFHDDEIDLFKTRGYQPLVIRKSNVAGLAALGVTARYVPHPYVPSIEPRASKLYHALCLARVDFRKRTHILLEANKTLEPERKAIHMYGEMNRVYEYHELRKRDPEWRRWYHGEFPDKIGQAVKMFASARFAIDLTQIKGDGGGTQYTFFEAWNAGIPLVLNRAWQTGNADEVAEGESCVMVEDAQGVVDVLRRPLSEFGHIVEGGRKIMEAHSPAAVGPAYLEAMHAST